LVEELKSEGAYRMSPVGEHREKSGTTKKKRGGKKVRDQLKCVHYLAKNG